MASDVQGTVREILISALENAGKSANGASEHLPSPGKGSSSLKGVAAGIGALALAPVALKGVSKLAKELGIESLDVLAAPEHALDGITSSLGDRVGAGIGQKISDKVDESGGPSGILKNTVKDALPFGGGDDDDDGDDVKGGSLGVGKGRRMPVQQSIDIGVPLESVYNQFVQFELWPQFMHRVVRVTQDDECTLSMAVKIWGKTKEFTAKIETQRPDERIKWRVSQGMTHTGVITFHELGPRLTRVMLDFDVEPGGMLEKAARGLRHIKRASRGDLHRFAAFIELKEQETGAWRGVIEAGKLVDDHDPKYDKGRKYSEPDATLEESESSAQRKPRQSRSSGRSNGRASGRSRSSGSSSRSGSSRTASSSRSGSSRTASSSRSGSSRAASTRRSAPSKTRGRQPKSGSSRSS